MKVKMEVINRRPMDSEINVVLVDRGHEYAVYLERKDRKGIFFDGRYFDKDKKEQAEQEYEKRYY